MEIIPAIDLLQGKCVRLVQGRAEEKKEYGNPLLIAQKWRAHGATRLHVVDLDAAFGSGKNEEIVTQLIGRGMHVQIGGGIRSLEKAREWMSVGIDRIILGTLLAEDPVESEKIVREFGKKVFAGIDCMNGKLMTRGWTGETKMEAMDFAKYCTLLGVGGIILTDISRDGTLTGPNFDLTKRIIEETRAPVIASGGVTTMEDVKKMKEIGASGVILGKTLYEGKLSLDEVIKNAK